MLDDAAFYAANSLVSDRFLLTTAFNLLFTRPMKAAGDRRGPLDQRAAAGVRRRGADRRFEGEECARGTGTFLRSHIALSGLAGYRSA